MERKSIAVAACLLVGCAAHEKVGTTSPWSSEWKPTTVELYERGRAPDACDGERVRSVTFGAGSNDIAPDDDLALDRLARCLEARPYSKEKVVVVGADDTRTAKVRQALVSHGISPRRIRIDSVRRNEGRVDIVLVGSSRH